MRMCLSFDTIRLRRLTIRIPMCIKPRDNLIFARLYAKELRVIFSQSGTLIKQVEPERPIYFSILVELTCYKLNLPLKRYWKL